MNVTRASKTAEPGSRYQPEPILLDCYEQQDHWFLGPPSRIHGRSHAARVLIWANTIAHWMMQDGHSVDLEVVRWAAVLHDVRRLDDGKDTEHGERSAAWIRSGRVATPLLLSLAQQEHIANCCQWHVPPDNAAPEMTSELRCLKDADSLDRVRLHDLDVRYLRTTYARLLVPHAKALFEGSEPSGPDAGWLSVRTAALELGVWMSDGLTYSKLLTRRNCCSL